MKTQWEEKVIWNKYPEVLSPSELEYYTIGIPDIMGLYAIDSLTHKDFKKNNVECWCHRLTTYSNFKKGTR
jgi:hypothetical protein